LLLGLPSTLGYGIWGGFTILGFQILDFFDFVTNNVMMPIVALFTAIIIAYVVKPKTVIDEVEISGKFRLKKLFVVMIKYVAPAFLLVILVFGIFGGLASLEAFKGVTWMQWFKI
jgi:NSS family neurotransmitter:Na+ symporter